jgi:CheY-like chemotaxis protein
VSVSGAEPVRRPAILVVEDEPGTREALQLLLDLEGYEVVTAANGMQGLHALVRSGFDLVITDQMMPMMDGVAFVAELRRDARFQRLPVIMMSASPRPPGAAAALMDAFIAKPFELPALLRLVERVVRHGRGDGAG